MSTPSPILGRVTHKHSVAMQLQATQVIELGNRNRLKDFDILTPDILTLARQIEVIASNASRMELHSDDAAPVEASGITTHGGRRFAETITTTRMMSVMLGRKRLLLSHTFASYTDTVIKRTNVDGISARRAYSRTLALPVNFFLQPLPSYIDSETGEVSDDVAIGYIESCKNMGFMAELYRLTDKELCAIVILGGDYEHRAALQIAKNLASIHKGINTEWSSLIRAVHCPLTLNAEAKLCTWYDKPLGDSPHILQSLIDFVSPSPSAESIFGCAPAPEVICADDEVDSELQQSSDIPEVPDLNEQPKSFTTDWIVSTSFRNECIEVLGTSDPCSLKLLGLWLWGWRDRATKLPIASNEILATLLGWEKRLSGKRQVVKPALDVLKRHTRVDINEHHYKGRATCFDLPDIPLKLIDLAREQYIPVADPVLLGSGARIREHIKKQDTWRRHVADSSTSNYPSDLSNALINGLNSLPANYFRKLTSTNWDKMLDRVLCLDIESRKSALKTLRHIQLHPQPVYKRAINTSRIYAVGYSYQSLRREIRNIPLARCLKVDLKHSQLSIACWMYGFRELDSMLADGTAWSFLCSQSGLSKGQIKTILYATLFMRSLEFDPYSHPALENRNLSQDDLRRFINVPELRALVAARERYVKHGLEDVEKDAFGNPLKASEYNVKLASLSQSYELKILSEATSYILKLKSNRICLWLHDGFFINGNSTKFNGISNNLTNLVDKSLNELGVISSLESFIPMSQ